MFYMLINYFVYVFCLHPAWLKMVAFRLNLGFRYKCLKLENLLINLKEKVKLINRTLTLGDLANKRP